MKAVMARILGRAGSGGALRWAWAALNTRRIETAQRRAENRTLPRRMDCLQLGRSSAAPLQDTGIGAANFEKSIIGRVAYTKAAMPVMRSPITSLWMSLVPS